LREGVAAQWQVIDPFDEMTSRRLAAVSVPSEMSALVVATGAPFGAVPIGVRLGPSGCALELGFSGVADVTAVLDAVRLLELLAGRIDLLAAIEGGKLDGSSPHVLLLAGVLDEGDLLECFDATRLGFVIDVVRDLRTPEGIDALQLACDTSAIAT
jgi:hypothetical protein